MYLSTDNVFDNGDTLVASALNPSALAPGASYTQTVQTGLPSVSPGNYFLILRVDANNDLVESDETNNTLVTAITIN